VGGRVGRKGDGLCFCGCVWNVPRGGMRRYQEPIEAAQSGHPPTKPGQRAQQSRTKSSAPRPVGLIHHSKVVTTMTHKHLAQCTACDDSFSLWSQTWASLLVDGLRCSSTGLRVGRGISKQSKQAAPPSHLVRLRHFDFSGRSPMPGSNLP